MSPLRVVGPGGTVKYHRSIPFQDVEVSVVPSGLRYRCRTPDPAMNRWAIVGSSYGTMPEIPATRATGVRRQAFLTG